MKTSKIMLATALLITASPTTAAAGDGTGLQTSVAVDLAGKFDTTKNGDSKNRLDVREAEISLSAPIDHLFDGVLSLAAHQEQGASLFEIHEAFVGSTKLIPNTRFRLGQYFLGIGRLNQIHRHDWPFISAPKVHSSFFGEEGAMDSGGEVAVILPLPFYVETLVGLSNGWKYGHSHSEGKEPKQPMHYGRMVTYQDLPGDVGGQLGLNFLQRNDSEGQVTTIQGIDLVGKWMQASYVVFLLQSESWLRRTKAPHSEESEEFGTYLYGQYALNSQIALGLRGDYFTSLSLKDALGKKLENSDTGVVPTLTFKSSEFATWRIAYNHQQSQLQGSQTKTIPVAEIQSTFILGAHPAHAF